MVMYYVYMLRCADGTFYIGFSNDVEKRVRIHNEGKAGAKYTKARRPVSLVYKELCESKSDALKREWQLKKLTRAQKQDLIMSQKETARVRVR